ncbi:MAG: helix-turn-helix domain-containing protein [Wenzhouxiangellaceae bacterium]
MKRQNSDIAPTYRVATPAEFGQRIRAERQRQDLTLDAFYAATGLTTRFVSEFERGKPNASIGRALLAAQALGLEVLMLPRGEAKRALAALAADNDHKSKS